MLFAQCLYNVDMHHLKLRANDGALELQSHGIGAASQGPLEGISEAAQKI